MNEIREHDELFDRHLRGELSEAEMEQLAQLLDSDPAMREQFVEFALWDARIADVLSDSAKTVPGDLRRRRSVLRWIIGTTVAISAVLLFAFLAAFNVEPPDSDRSGEPVRHVVKITGMGGSLQWTGDGGEIVQNLKIGDRLPGGTIEALTPDSWFKADFDDGSSVAITGISRLTISAIGRKVLHLKKGSLNCNVRPQPTGQPMRIHTQSALLEVLGTRFDVEVDSASTLINVTEGKVRVQRLSDRATVEVSAGLRLVVAADRKMVALRVPDSINTWKSLLELGPDGTYGKWSPTTDQGPARLKAIAFVPPENRRVTLNMLGLHVSCVNGSPVVLEQGSRFVVRGRMTSASRLYFGFQLAHPNGEFAGKFLAEKPRAGFHDGKSFTATFQLDEFAIDPSVRDLRLNLPGRPDGLVVTGVWCFTHQNGKRGNSGLEITEVELIPPK